MKTAKRLTALLLAALVCLTLAACAERNDAPGTPDDPPAADGPAIPDASAEPLALSALNVEFVTGGRDTEALLALQREFPAALAGALAAQNVAVGAVNVTFGTSDEATVEALRLGAVDAAFLSAGGFFTFERAGDPLCVAVEDGAGPTTDVSLLAVSASADGRLAAALRGALGALTAPLARYTNEDAGGAYTAEPDALANLRRLCETGDAVLHSETASVGGAELTLRGVGRKLGDSLWGVRSIEVEAGGETAQELRMSETGELDEYTQCLTPELAFRAVDANFDGNDDVEVFGWPTNSTPPYFYWLWNAETRRYEYAFSLQGAAVDAEKQELTAVYRESAAESYVDTYRWIDGRLTLVSHELAVG